MVRGGGDAGIMVALFGRAAYPWNLSFVPCIRTLGSWLKASKRTRSGSRPGDSLADICFNVILRAVQDILAQLEAEGLANTVSLPTSSPMLKGLFNL